MSLLELFFIAVGLSMDAFAISICQGLKMQKPDLKKGALIAFFFGFFQALMPYLGWLTGQLFASYVDRYDHYIAFALLGYLGAKMLWDTLHPDEEKNDGDAIDMKSLFAMAFATSVDALAVGVTFGMDPKVRIIPAAAIIGITTFAICICGVTVGNAFGARWQRRAQLLGGAMLILVGSKILLEGLGLMNIPL